MYSSILNNLVEGRNCEVNNFLTPDKFCVLLTSRLSSCCTYPVTVEAVIARVQIELIATLEKYLNVDSRRMSQPLVLDLPKHTQKLAAQKPF